MGLYRIKEIREWSDGEIRKRLSELRAELIRLRRSGAGSTTTDNPARIRLIRQAIAQILTVLNERARAKE